MAQASPAAWPPTSSLNSEALARCPLTLPSLPPGSRPKGSVPPYWEPRKWNLEWLRIQIPHGLQTTGNKTLNGCHLKVKVYANLYFDI